MQESNEHQVYCACNWSNKAEYPANDEALSLDEWKWEFLRRNKEYCAAWANRNAEQLDYIVYSLSGGWVDPNDNKAPKFLRPDFIKFVAEDVGAIQLHYYALQQVQQNYPSAFSFNFFCPIEPQIEVVRNAFDDWHRLHSDPRAKPQRQPKKNNSPKSKKFRSRTLLLRVLDAHNSGVKAHEILRVLVEAGDHEAVYDSAMRRTIAYAKDFWKQL